ncbi:MAG: sensor histidine kinase [Lachnospiraceae bacterium]
MTQHTKKEAEKKRGLLQHLSLQSFRRFGMIQKLHIQLTALCTAITGLVLAVLTVICLSISESGIRGQEAAAFQTNLNTLYENLEVQTALSHNWIRQMEFHYQFTIRLFDNGIPLFYQQITEDAQMDALAEQTIRTARQEHAIDLEDPSSAGMLGQHAEFTVYDKAGNPYNASAAVVPRGTGVLSAIVLHPLAPMRARILHQRISFAAADLAALLALCIFFWFFTARMIRPIQENRKKQIQFVAAASHELRSPLTVILSNIAAVRSRLMPCDDTFLDTLDSESSRMSRLINDMLQLAGADNHTWSMQLQEAEPDTLLLQTWENFESMALSKGLRFDIELPEDSVPPVCCDAERIRQLLSILIDNAFSYTPRGGRVCLSLSTDTPDFLAGGARSSSSRDSGAKGFAPRKNALYLSVIDNGPGIPDDSKAAVFERFQQLDSSRRDKSHFGLGLCIAQEIAQLHHGQLLLTDTPGGGATFTVVLEY